MNINIHHTAGRLRLKLAQIRKNPARAQTIQDEARRFDGVTSAVANSVTGSLLIHYDPAQTNAGAIMRALAQAGWLPPAAVARNSASTSSLHPLAGKLLDSVAEKLIERSAIALLGALL